MYSEHLEREGGRERVHFHYFCLSLTHYVFRMIFEEPCTECLKLLYLFSIGGSSISADKKNCNRWQVMVAKLNWIKSASCALQLPLL